MAARSLITLTPVSITAAYDPIVFDQILLIIYTNGSITVTFSDTSTLDFFGYLRSFQPNEHSEGAQPTAGIMIQPTNIDPATLLEVAPNFTNNSGT